MDWSLYRQEGILSTRFLKVRDNQALDLNRARKEKEKKKTQNSLEIWKIGQLSSCLCRKYAKE